MKRLNVVQGTPEWHAERAKRFTASEAAAMMGASPYMTRDQLLHQKATGIVPEVDAATQRRFDDGHRVEALARSITEQEIGEDLFPVTGVHDDLDWMLASFDGLTMMDDRSWEHKLWNESLAAKVRDGSVADDPAYYWQLEQQCFVSGLSETDFTVSDGTEKNRETCTYRVVPGRIDKLLAGWEQFRKDLEAYTPPEAVAEPVAAPVEALPAVTVNVTGSLAVKSNLDEFEKRAMAFIGGINTDLQTDQHFADAEAVVKFCDKAEKEIDVVKSQVLAQVADIDTVTRMLDKVKAELRTKRLELSKMVDARKASIRSEIVTNAQGEFRKHMDALADVVWPAKLPTVAADFAGAMKGKKTITSLRGAANDELARAKIEANQLADKIAGNIKAIEAELRDYAFLFLDLDMIAQKDRDDLMNLAKLRISEHKGAEEKRLEAERQRIADEERRKLEAAQKAGEAEGGMDAVAKTETKVTSLPDRKQPKPEPDAGLMAELANWCDAWRIPQQAADELVEIVQPYMPEASSRKA